MAEIDLRTLPQSDVVLHFGGRPYEVDAFTFSNSLVAFADALREINRQINSNFSLEVTIEGAGPGSFRAKIGTRVKSVGGLFKSDARSLLINLLATFLYVRVLDPTSPQQVIINDDEVIVQDGGDRIIIPRSTWDARKAMKQPKAVERHVARAFEVINDDPSITDFGLAVGLADKNTVGDITRDRFAILSNPPAEESNDHKSFRDERTKLTIIKAVFERGNRKWQFVWNGIRISAPIKDDAFFDKLSARQYNFSQGDVLDVTLRIHQLKDDMSGVMINDHYEIVQVHGQDKTPKQALLFYGEWRPPSNLN